jgi:Sulfotransferase family
VNPARTDICQQLTVPDRTGRDLALLRTRLYRFSSDQRWYVFAESLEENYLAGGPPQPATMTAIRSCLDKIRHGGSPTEFPDDLASAEDIDISAGLDEREPYSWHRVPRPSQPPNVVVIVGAPRSGTSHLFNLLAATGRFAYFTTASCWMWPVRNLHQPRRQLFESLADMVLTVDNKQTRVTPGLVMPGEAEDIWHRAMPIYRHIRGHQYDIGTQPEPGEPRILHAAAHAHLAHFNRATLLVKSPFNSFRILLIEQHWGPARYIHIVRDRRETADSIRRNHFEFSVGSRLLDSESAWSLFVNAVQEQAPAERTHVVHHDELLHDPQGVTGRLVLSL